MKKLAKYVAEERGRKFALSEALGCSPSTIQRIASGEIPDPRISLVLGLERATGGIIKPSDWAKK